MKVFTPDEVALPNPFTDEDEAERTESKYPKSKYLGVLVAAKYACELNSMPRDVMPLGAEEKLTTRALNALTADEIEFRLVKRRRNDEE